MANILNGGVYSVLFTGRSSAEFNGNHPAVVFQTMKEPDMFVAIPLTSYTQERWSNVRTKGFAIRLQTTNSIARVDKMQILHKRDIRNRWKEFGNFSKITPDELSNLKTKLSTYIKISTDLTEKDYHKYYKQYEDTLNYISDCKNGILSTDNYCSLDITDNLYTLTIKKSNINKLPSNDVLEIVSNVFADTKIEPIIKNKGKNSPLVCVTFKP